VGIELPKYFNPHYAAPLTGALYALGLTAMRHLRLWQWRSQPVGLQIVRAVPVLAVAMLVLHTSALLLKLGTSEPSQDSGRIAILAQLQGYSGGQLVVVRFDPDHDPPDEWLYNDADIDAAKVVWARDMGTLANEELIRYFKDRRVWLLEADKLPPKLLPYCISVKPAGFPAIHNSQSELRFWDQGLIPLSRILDKVFLYAVGKSTLAAWRMS
jgi:hypothetical protein